ncbi:chorismate--pyruvate lyase family protein [Methanobrevibacter sp.]
MKNKGKQIKSETYELIQQLEEEHGIQLSAIQKILSSLGPMGVPLTALYGTLRLFALNQYVKSADEDEAEQLDIAEGSEILYREVIVHKGGHPLFYGLTRIPTERCSDEVLQSLLDMQVTIDAIMSENNIETTREVTELTVEKPTPVLQELFNTREDMLSREYTITQHGKIRLWAKEVYPLSYFRDL